MQSSTRWNRCGQGGLAGKMDSARESSGRAHEWRGDSRRDPRERSENGTGRERVDRFLRFAHELSSSSDERRTAALVTKHLVGLFDASLAAAYLTTSDGELTLVATSGRAAASVESPPAIAVRALSLGSLAVGDEFEARQVRSGDPSRVRAVASPILVDGTPAGVLVAATPAGSPLDADPLLLSIVADMTASSLANARRLTAALAEARRDALTGLGNQRAFHEHADSLLGEARWAGGEVALVIFDLDDFKEINDTHGHPAGDEALRHVARVVLRSLRTSELVFRVGGEEFAVVVEGGSAAGAHVAERLRRAVLRHRRGPELPTISAGVASFPRDADSKHRLIRKADLALYAAKRAGKNRVALYQPGARA